MVGNLELARDQFGCGRLDRMADISFCGSVSSELISREISWNFASQEQTLVARPHHGWRAIIEYWVQVIES